MNRVPILLDALRFARRYTESVIESVPADSWYIMPPGLPTHVAWQVGHLAMADYRLLLERIRGRRADDEALISSDFLALFGKGSVPSADASLYPSRDEILATVARVRRQALAELAELPDASLDEEVLKPHPLFHLKADSLRWNVTHEGVHCGQISLLRRAIGLAPNW